MTQQNNSSPEAEPSWLSLRVQPFVLDFYCPCPHASPRPLPSVPPPPPSHCQVAWLFNLRGSDVDCSPVFLSYALVSASKGAATLYVEPGKVTAQVAAKLKVRTCC